MFVLVEIYDSVKLHPSAKNLIPEIILELNKKYTNRIVSEIGLAIKTYSIKKVDNYKIVDGYLIASVKFLMLFFRFFKDEVLFAKIDKQEEDGIRLVMPFLTDIWVDRTKLPEMCSKAYALSKTNNRRYVYWCWLYRDNKLYFKNNVLVRFKVDEIMYKPFMLSGSFMDSGLGPISWWI
ncbi:DNA-directed RNA polymerase III subunit rpc8 [Astathelohania contejeani]|uniref:DNA-directed RNA polymerase III subunit rpc8 n=1 Tax=Astathelohania contejeani TaxID=164912 RepID=A0ABQ7HVE5_9MICR|nr:DNA-directed RNA polymerase III subunit rpc8 [Thelohania contejeani]